MIDDVRDSYGALVDLYTEVNRGGLDNDRLSREWTAEFAKQAAVGDGLVADLGCGPGFVTNHLAQLGLNVVGYDITPAMVLKAQRLFPELTFEVGDITALAVADSAFAGVMSRYSLIHMPVDELDNAFSEFARVLKPGAPALVSFFAANSAEKHGSPFDHKVTTAYELFPDTIVSTMQAAGFDDFKIGVQGPSEGQRPLDHATLLAHRASS